MTIFFLRPKDKSLSFFSSSFLAHQYTFVCKDKNIYFNKRFFQQKVYSANHFCLFAIYTNAFQVPPPRGSWRGLLSHLITPLIP